MNIEEKINNLKKYISFSEKECNFPSIFDWNWHMELANDIETLLTAYEKENKIIDLMAQELIDQQVRAFKDNFDPFKYINKEQVKKYFEERCK